MLTSTLVVPLAVSGAVAQTDPPPADDEFSALVFSHTEGFRHGSIESGVAAIVQLGDENGFTVDHTEDPADFTTENLSDYDVVVWLSTTGDVLNSDQQAAFEGYIQSGGGYAGIHAASDTEYDWAWYGELVGAYFESHPPGTPDATVQVADHAHPSTAHLPFEWDRTDEWYTYQDNPRGDVHVLASLDEDSYDVGSHAMGHDHPIAWCQNYDGGRSWYTGGGHTNESFAEPAFLEHILGGIQTAAGVADADCAATVESSFEQTTLVMGEQNVGEPIALAVLPNGDVVHSARDGRIFYTTGDSLSHTAGTIPVYSHDEDGLQGLAVDANFAENRWVYAYYAPVLDTPAGDAPEFGTAEQFAAFDGYNQLSRFKLTESNMIDLASEQKILEVEADRGTCCHAGGEIDFDAEGNLWLSTGDDTNPFASNGYTPIDERADRNPAWDAQRSSGNTNDLRGKLLRISVNEDGSYDIPEGNLFEPGTELTRPEIYAMGFRNPFRFSVDHETGWVHLGDYGPDAGGAANPDRGPQGQVEFNLIKEPGNYGWPYCHGANDAYIDYDFGTEESGAAFDCDNPVNESPNNTGLTELPPAVPAWLPYDGGSVPELGNGSESPMGGPTYRYDAELDSDTKWPEYFDGKTFNYEWGRGWIHEFVIDDDGNLVDILPTLDHLDVQLPIAVEFGPDGAMYVLDYGTGGYFSGAPDSAVYRIDYVAGSRNPSATITTSATNGQAPLTVEFDGSGSSDPEGEPLSYAWDFENDGTVDSTDATASHTYTEEGQYTARLTVSAGEGEGVRTGTATVNIVVGNTAPQVTLEIPEDGSIFGFGDQVPYRVEVTDAEDGEIDCSRVRVEYILGHDDHGHPLTSTTGCEGVIVTPNDEGHGLDADIFGVINASYIDLGAGDLPALRADDEAVLRLRNQQAEFYTDSEGVNVFAKDGARGGAQVGDIHNGDWISFDPMNFVNIDGVSVRYASAGAGGTLEVRQGAPDGPLAATIELAPTGGWETWAVSETVPITDAGGEGPVYFVFTGDPTQALFDVDEIRFSGKGAATNAAPVVSASVTPEQGTAPLEVTFTATAEDPDGDEVSLAWDFGDGSTGDGAEVTHTYTAAGSYTATVTASDPGGATATATVTVTVNEPAMQCFSGRSDDFTGDALDTERWSVVRQDDNLRVEDGHLVMPTSQTDIYGTNNTDSPNLVLQDLPDGPFTATVKVTMDGTDAYQQAGLLLYGDDDNYAKMVFQDRSANSAERVFQFIREENGLPNEVADSNSPTLGADYPTTVWVQLASDGENLTAAYSADGVDFTQMAETKSLVGITDPQIGMFAVQGSGQAQAPVDAAFDYFTITPDDTATADDPNDEFDGTALNDCRWDVVRPDADHLRVTDGHLELDATAGDIYGGDNQTPANFVLQQLEGDWTVETVVDVSETSQQYEQGGLIAHVDDDNYVKLDVLTTNAPGSAAVRSIEIRSEIDSVVQNPQPTSPAITATTVHLRLTKAGATFTGSYSVDGGETWTDLESVTNAGVAADGRVGLFALGAASPDEPTIRFDHFRVIGDEPPVEPVLVPVDKVSIGLYSLIPWVNAEGQQAVLARLAEIGLENIEPYGGNFDGYTAEQFRAVTDEIGLRVPSSHYNTAEASFDDTLVYVDTLGQEYVGSGGFVQGLNFNSYESTLAVAEAMNRLGERSVEAGIGKFFGHNHAGEFTTTYEHEGEELSVWEILVDQTNPEYVTFQVDVAWAAHAGVDVPALIEEHGERIELLHIKDATGLGGSISFTNLGEGDVDLQGILAAAEEHAEIAYYVLEYDVAPQGEDFVVTGFEYLTGQEAGEEGSRPVEVTPAEVTFIDEDGTEDDTYTVPWDVGVEYLVDGEVVEAATVPGSGAVTVTARVLDGFVLAEGAVAQWSHTFSTAEEPELVEVTPEAVTFTDEDGTEDDAFTVPEVDGVEYVVDGDVIPAGTHSGVGEVTVTARALDGFVLAEGASAQWSHVFSTEGEEPEPEPEPSSAAEFHLSDNWRGTTHHFFKYGRITDEVYVGDWDGDGTDSIAVRRGNEFFVSNAPRGGDADWTFRYGRPGDVVLVGDWDGDGRDTFAVRRGNEYHVKN
ncbi:ThuA domain-containing protein, partial [Georgenia sp. MJ170]|uniref:ThuA domain-containing protein n=1 Tax=Georgenia sunbinii TaxID=3117728 RepID=UPI002F25F38E